MQPTCQAFLRKAAVALRYMKCGIAASRLRWCWPPPENEDTQCWISLDYKHSPALVHGLRRMLLMALVLLRCWRGGELERVVMA